MRKTCIFCDSPTKSISYDVKPGESIITDIFYYSCGEIVTRHCDAKGFRFEYNNKCHFMDLGIV